MDHSDSDMDYHAGDHSDSDMDYHAGRMLPFLPASGMGSLTKSRIASIYWPAEPWFDAPIYAWRTAQRETSSQVNVKILS